MPEIVVELLDGDVTPLLPHLETAAFLNLHPGVDAQEVPPSGPFGGLFGNRGPVVPLATWTPGEIGLQHAVGQQVTRFLAERGVVVPDDWYKVSEHPKRGIVLRTYQTPPQAVLEWLVQAARAACPLDITGPWHAVVHPR